MGRISSVRVCGEERRVMFIAHYYRYYNPGTEEFDTYEEAEQFLEGGSDQGALWAEKITDGNGEVYGTSMPSILR
jgi:hypothetical protein